MDAPRTYRVFSHQDARYRIASTHYEIIIEEIKRLRTELEIYIDTHPEFQSSLVPVNLKPHAPPVACFMAEAAWAAGVGPMAAVAGAFAEYGVRRALAAGASEAIIDNGGDIFLASRETVVVGVFVANNPLSGRLALRVRPEDMPLALCSSSGTMGHSLSLGKCDLALIAAQNAALADAVATRAANLVSSRADIPRALAAAERVPGVGGALIVMGEAVGMTGTLPEIIRHADSRMAKKIPAHASWRGLFSW
jgi:uncharacterized protein